MYSDRSFKRKRFSSLIIAGGYSLVGGVEYVMILPTVWNYLQSLGVEEEYYLGFTVSIYSFAAAIAGVIGGRLADMYSDHTKLLVLLSILLRAWGNFNYMLGISVWNVLGARFISGVGTAAGTAILAEICRTTTLEERTPMLAVNNAMFELGILIGPAFQLFLSYFQFSIFGLEINPLNASGLFMTCFWLLYGLATFFLYHNLAEEFRQLEKLRRNGIMLPNEHISSGIVAPNNERFVTSIDSVHNTSRGDLTEASIAVRATYDQYVKEFVTDTFVLILFMLFSVLFCVTAFDTVIPVITQDHFGFGVFQNSLIYMAGGLEALVLFFVVGMMTKYVRDTTFQFYGWLLLLLSQIWFMVVIPTLEQGNTAHIIYFMAGAMLLYAANPIAYTAGTSLLSKVLSNETQGLGQGFLRLAIYSGLIFGPSWAGSTITSPYLFLGVSIAILLANGIMLAFSFKSLRHAEDVVYAAYRKDNLVPTERDPLLKPEEA